MRPTPAGWETGGTPLPGLHSSCVRRSHTTWPRLAPPLPVGKPAVRPSPACIGIQPLKWLLGACRQQHSATQVTASGLRPRSRRMPTLSPAPGTAQPAERVSWRHAPRGACIRRMLGTTRLCERYCACADSPPQARPAVQAKRHAGSAGFWSARGAWAALAQMGYRFATTGRRMVYFLPSPLCGDIGPHGEVRCTLPTRCNG